MLAGPRLIDQNSTIDQAQRLVKNSILAIEAPEENVDDDDWVADADEVEQVVERARRADGEDPGPDHRPDGADGAPGGPSPPTGDDGLHTFRLCPHILPVLYLFLNHLDIPLCSPPPFLCSQHGEWPLSVAYFICMIFGHGLSGRFFALQLSSPLPKHVHPPFHLNSPSGCLSICPFLSTAFSWPLIPASISLATASPMWCVTTETSAGHTKVVPLTGLNLRLSTPSRGLTWRTKPDRTCLAPLCRGR
jgi:hypothetical protein